MSKYEPLRNFLKSKTSEAIPMTFAEVEAVLGFKLPPSHRYRAWWSNNSFNNVMTNEWLAAGYKTEQVDIEGRKLVFRRTKREGGVAKASDTEKAGAAPDEKRPRRHPLIGAMKDVTWIAPGIDLTEPADPQWADLTEDPDWGRLPE